MKSCLSFTLPDSSKISNEEAAIESHYSHSQRWAQESAQQHGHALGNLSPPLLPPSASMELSLSNPICPARHNKTQREPGKQTDEGEGKRGEGRRGGWISCRHTLGSVCVCDRERIREKERQRVWDRMCVFYEIPALFELIDLKLPLADRFGRCLCVYMRDIAGTQGRTETCVYIYKTASALWIVRVSVLFACLLVYLCQLKFSLCI